MDHNAPSAPASIVDWLAGDVAGRTAPAAQRAAEAIARDYDEVIPDRAVLEQHLTVASLGAHRTPATEFANVVWDAAREVLSAKGLPEDAVDAIVEAADGLPDAVVELVDLDWPAIAAAHEPDIDAAADYARTESRALARSGR